MSKFFLSRYVRLPWGYIILLAWLGLMLYEAGERWYDARVRTRPWISAELRVIENGGDLPLIGYKVNASTLLEGRWTAWVSVNGRRSCGGGGPGSYKARHPDREMPVWEWYAFFESACKPPTIPFSICVTYTVATRARATDKFGPFCSPTFDPNARKDL